MYRQLFTLFLHYGSLIKAKQICGNINSLNNKIIVFGPEIVGRIHVFNSNRFNRSEALQNVTLDRDQRLDVC